MEYYRGINGSRKLVREEKDSYEPRNLDDFLKNCCVALYEEVYSNGSYLFHSLILSYNYLNYLQSYKDYSNLRGEAVYGLDMPLVERHYIH